MSFATKRQKVAESLISLEIAELITKTRAQIEKAALEKSKGTISSFEIHTAFETILEKLVSK